MGNGPPATPGTAQLAFGYIHGIPEQHWDGMLVDRNDWEMYAGLGQRHDGGDGASFRRISVCARCSTTACFAQLPDTAPITRRGPTPHG